MTLVFVQQLKDVLVLALPSWSKMAPAVSVTTLL